MIIAFHNKLDIQAITEGRHYLVIYWATALKAMAGNIFIRKYLRGAVFFHCTIATFIEVFTNNRMFLSQENYSNQN